MRCPSCGKQKFLTRHHKDGNHNNNLPSNIKLICRECHDKEHVKDGMIIKKNYSQVWANYDILKTKDFCKAIKQLDKMGYGVPIVVSNYHDGSNNKTNN